ncbi:ferritin-like domain-containing protein [Micromonospora lutea]|uniref:Ferritin-like domain-containing protein n=1 Tax=Micromonospora lutea TaxID=419825 RepID=A0ABQ4IT20_9ACTN|nr:ferritin-like domain-containing protein [Micromonospora lutea]GIJ21075.1 hypothetical protein Vlu01_16990 [Micromonospora lutea]
MSDRTTSIDSSFAAQFTWDYESTNSNMRRLYEQGKAAQWNATTDIDWSVDLSFDALVTRRPGFSAAPLQVGGRKSPVPPELWDTFNWEYHSWLTSQFLHGEQGALLATSRLVEVVPDIDSKLYAGAQVADEARHVEVYAKYLALLGNSYPVNPALQEMLGDVISESRWDVIYLGMQIIVEGLALAVFRIEHARSFNPVIRRITELVARDEARHVAFGVLALKGMYAELSSRELREREEFVMESALLMARRFRLEEVWQRLDLDVDAGIAYAAEDPAMADFRRLMFSKIVTCLNQLGLMTDTIRSHLRQLTLLRPA